MVRPTHFKIQPFTKMTNPRCSFDARAGRVSASGPQYVASLLSQEAKYL
jgi:hypothetical protein